MNKILGIDVGGTKIATILVDPEQNLKVLGKNRINTEAEKGKAHIIENIFGSVDFILKRCNLTENDLSGIGIALPGPVDNGSGISFECPNLKGWVNVEIKKILQEKYGTFVFIENDARAAAAGEACCGAGKDIRNFLYITISTGIGCGVVIDGKLYRGADGAAGELSHVIFSDGRELYSLASGKALQNLFSIPAEELKDQYNSGNSTAVKAYEHLLHYLSIGIANAVTLFNPGAVIIGGGLSNLGDFLLKPLEKEVKKKAFSVSGENVKFLNAENKNDAGVLGIASLVIEELAK